MDSPEKIKFKGATYVLAERGKKPKTADDVYTNVRLRGEGVSFYINVLLRSKDAEGLPFTRKAKSIPDSVQLTADQLDEALKAKKDGELWHIYAEDVGWRWKVNDGDKADFSKVEDIQKILDLLEKYKDRSRNPVIYASVSNKIVGKW